MSRFLQLCLIFLFVAAAAIVSDTSADEAAISDDYFYDYDLYSYDDIIDALYSDEGEKTINRYCFDQTTREPFFPAEELLPSESRQRPQRRKKRPKGQKRQKQQEFAKANHEVRYLQ